MKPDPPAPILADGEHRTASGQAEPFRTGASRIDESDALELDVLGDVAVAEDDEPGMPPRNEGRDTAVQTSGAAEAMDDEGGNGSQVEETKGWKTAASSRAVDIASHRPHRRHAPECLQYLVSANVAGMEDQVDAAEDLPQRWVDHPVGVGDETTADRAVRHSPSIAAGGAAG